MKNIYSPFLFMLVGFISTNVSYAGYKCVVIPANQNIEIFDSYQLSSLDKLEMQAGVGSDDNSLYFTPDTQAGRSLNIVTPGGFAYLVKEGTTLRIEDDGVGEKTQIVKDMGGCEELAALLEDDNTAAYLTLGALAAAGFLIFDDDDDNDAVATTVTTPSSGNAGDFCGIPGCSSEQSFLNGRCSKTPSDFDLAQLRNCGIDVSLNFCGIINCSGCGSFNAGLCSVKPDQPNNCGCSTASPSS